MDRLYGLILDQSRPPGPIVGPSGALGQSGYRISICSLLRMRHILVWLNFGKDLDQENELGGWELMVS